MEGGLSLSTLAFTFDIFTAVVVVELAPGRGWMSGPREEGVSPLPFRSRQNVAFYPVSIDWCMYQRNLRGTCTSEIRK